MGRKKKKSLKPWCWYCNREFDEEKVLIYHQKAKHFKCPVCNKKSYTGPGLLLHCMQVHRHEIKSIPNALPDRSDPEIEIFGTEGIPFLDIVSRSKEKNVDIIIREKNIANAALPAKFEKTLETPYGTQIERKIKPMSPDSLPLHSHSILKPTLTSSNNLDQVNLGDPSFNPTGPYKIDVEKIVLPALRCKLYHPLEDISLEEHRLRFKKYSDLLTQADQYSAQSHQNQQQYPYPPYPYPPYQAHYPYPGQPPMPDFPQTAQPFPPPPQQYPYPYPPYNYDGQQNPNYHGYM